jgi:hypothetical protein
VTVIVWRKFEETMTIHPATRVLPAVPCHHGLSLVNFFLEAAAIDAAVYVGVGLPELRAAPPAVDPPEGGNPARCSREGDREYSLDFGGQHLAYNMVELD